MTRRAMPTMQAFPRLSLSLLLLGCSCASATQPQAPFGKQSSQLTASPAATATAPGVADTLPFGLNLTVLDLPNAPKLSAYQVASVGDDWFIAGGRTAGLHTFKSQEADNFPGPNTALWLINPKTKRVARVDTQYFKSIELRKFFSATNAQSYFDGTWMHLVGGYGAMEPKGPHNYDTGTQDLLVRIPVAQVIAVFNASMGEAQRAAKIESLLKVSRNEILGVTGGGLFRLDPAANDPFMLVFGQKFMGRYSAFGGDFDQKYTEEIRTFSILNDTISPTGSTTDPSGQFHRRDGNIFEEYDPTSGALRVTATGGVFQEGQIAGFVHPVYIDGTAHATVDTSFTQLFSAYECPVLVGYSNAARKTYRTYFGGISHYYYRFTEAQQQMYDQVTAEGRNDGLPFISDITTVVQDSSGASKEWIHRISMPDQRLLGSSVHFIPDNSAIQAGILDRRGILLTDKLGLPGRTVTVGYIYGGIEADYPLPKVPNAGTQAVNTVIEVQVVSGATSGIDVANAKEAKGSYSHQ